MNRALSVVARRFNVGRAGLRGAGAEAGSGDALQPAGKSKMQAVFIRHNLDATPDTLEDLWSRRLIAVHYESIASTDPEDYGLAGKAALKRLHRYCSSGAIVGATYRSIHPDTILVGEIEKGSQVEVRPYSQDPDYHDYLFKVVQLQSAREVPYLDYPLLAAIQPKQATITGWPSAEKYLSAILQREQIEWSVDSLAPGQLEVICYEFLRMTGVLKALLLPIGRSLPDIDICGIDEHGNKVLAQVTHADETPEMRGKLNRLKEYHSHSVKLIFFGPESIRFDDSAIQYNFTR